MRANEHLAKARHNERFLQELRLDTTDFLDWAVTVAFYSALHYIDALLAYNHGFDPKDHRERSTELTRHAHLRKNVKYSFEDLKNDGIEARYTDRVFTAEEYRDHIQPRLQEVRTYVERFVPT